MKYTTRGGRLDDQILLLPTIAIDRVFGENIISFGFLFWFYKVIISKKR